MSSTKAAAAKGIILLAVAATAPDWFTATTALYWLLRVAGRHFEEKEHDHG